MESFFQKLKTTGGQTKINILHHSPSYNFLNLVTQYFKRYSRPLLGFQLAPWPSFHRGGYFSTNNSGKIHNRRKS